MARIELAPEVGADFERILDHLQHYEVEHVEARLREIIAAVDVLQTSPLIGRPAGNDKRELVIGRGSHGYVALYRYVAGIDTVFVLAVRAQREAGFAGP
ncbi:MAG: type II toxin-antitoxin system RelE/ParE family toxin [Rhodanobacter sp.]